jgi:hypothetical protein
MHFFFLAKVNFLWLLLHFEYSIGEEYSQSFDPFGHEGIDFENHFDEVFQYQISRA